jgi:pyruvate/oxaloacetate carboxyltransferase
MDAFLVFDALNDIQMYAVDRRRALTGKHAQGTICYTVSPLHTTTQFVEMAEQLDGCDSICITMAVLAEARL